MKGQLRWSKPSNSRIQMATITSELAHLSQVIKTSRLDQPRLLARRHSLLSPISICREKTLLSPTHTSPNLTPLSTSPKAARTFSKALDLMTKLFGPVPPLQPHLQRNAKRNVLLVITDSTGVVTARTPLSLTSTLQNLQDFEDQSKMFKRSGSMRALPSGNSKLTPTEHRSYPRRMKSISTTISASLT